MGQSGRPALQHFVLTLLAAVLASAGAGCDRGTAAPPAVVRMAKRPTVASLSPAATDILLAIGAQDHLVAISNYDYGKPAVAGLPGAGDYLTVDWEQLAKLQPDVLIVQVREALAPKGFKERADSLKIRPVYIHIDDIDDIVEATRTLGDAVAEPDKAAAATKAMRDRLVAVAQSVAGRPRVLTLVITDEVGAGVAGPDTFVDELLTIAGGANAAANEGGGYPRIDREKIVSLHPEVVLHLLPSKPGPMIEEARRFWATMPDVPAVKNGKVHILTEPSVMHPGLGVGETAALFADKLHPDRGTTTQPASYPIQQASP
jgi:iron complex transport system substrate-binding protein